MADDGRRALLENQTLARHVKMLQAELVRARQLADAQQRRVELLEEAARRAYRLAAGAQLTAREHNATKADD
jgi:hypothetical protein